MIIFHNDIVNRLEQIKSGNKHNHFFVKRHYKLETVYDCVAEIRSDSNLQQLFEN